MIRLTLCIILLTFITMLCPSHVNGGIVDVTLVAAAMHGWPDGIAYDLLAYNGSVPGPEIHITVGDTLIIRLINNLPDNMTTSLHLHGVVQYHNNGYDGVPGVTQCPLLNGQSFEYRTIIEERDQGAGTYWYHSHSGSQRGEGLYGALIVHPIQPTRYHEHVMFITDWWHYPLSKIWQHYVWAIPSYVASEHRHQPKINASQVDGGAFVLNGVLVNGRGYVNCSSLPQPSPYAECRDDHTNYTVFHVRRGEQLLLRMIGSMMALELAISIDDHPYTILATDGCPTQPVITNLLVVASGETYDIAFTANRSHSEAGSSSNGRYWIRGCEPYRCGRLSEWRTIAIIEYDDWYDNNTTSSGAISDEPAIGSDHNQVWPDSRPVESVIYDFMDLRPLVQPPHFVPTHNLTITTRQEWEMAGVQYEASTIPLSMLAERDITIDPITASVVSYPIGSVVLVIINSWMQFTHAMHLHGHYFYLIGMGKFGDNYFNATRDWSSLNFVNPVAKHSVNMQPHTWMAVLFEVDNPGYWMFHCHLDFHMEVGMAMVFRDGGPGWYKNQSDEDEWHRLVRPPAESSRWCLPNDTKKNAWPLWLIATIGGSASVVLILTMICICTRCRVCRGRGHNTLDETKSINEHYEQQPVVTATTAARGVTYTGYQQHQQAPRDD